MPGPYYMAWCDEATAWGPDLERFDERIFALEVSQSEGAFAQLTLDVKHPNMGLLAPGRQQWCWLAWFDGLAVQPLFHGRVLGAPENLEGEIWRLVFRAKPSDYDARKAALADTLRVLPFWDPVWLDKSVDDPDTVLETRTALWHIDRTTLEVTISDLTEGEDGVIDVSKQFYDSITVGYGSTPLRRINVTGTITWTQLGAGEVDLTASLVAAFQAAGSFFPYPMVSSYTADGLLADWPKPEASLSGGWSMSANPSAAVAGGMAPINYAVRYTDKSDDTHVTGFDQTTFPDVLGNHAGQVAHDFFINWKNYDVHFVLQPLLVDFRVAYEASRKRSEIITFTVTAAAQSILTDPEGTEEEAIALTSTFVDQPVDPEGAMPIGDPRRNAYFPTDRGQLSLQFLMLLARQKLVVRSRAVNITFQDTWEKLAVAISCRKSVLLHDYRLPGGQAAGKVTSYRLVASDAGDNLVEVTIGCSIGYGDLLPALEAGEDSYATDYATGYTARTGGQVAVIDRALHYENMAGTYVVDDDGVDLFNMTPATVILGLSITDGPNAQHQAIDASLSPGFLPDVNILTRGEIAGSGTTVANLQKVDGLVAGGIYLFKGGGVPDVNKPAFGTAVQGTATDGGPTLTITPPAMAVPTLFTFDGNTGGSLSQAGKIGVGQQFTIASRFDRVPLTPDPVGALNDHPTIVTLDLVPVTGGDFQTDYTVNVLDLVIPKTIDLEAA